MHIQRTQRSRLLCVLLLLTLLNPPLGAAAAGIAETAVSLLGASHLYTIRSGDTLWHIALAHNTTVEQLLALNRELGDVRLLRPGQTIRVPAQAASPAEPEVPILSPQSEVDPEAEAAAAPGSEPEPPAAAVLPPEIAGWPDALLTLINEKRAAHGLHPLVWSPGLTAAAQAHAEDCAQRNRGSHIGSDGSRLRERLARAGYQASWASENWVYAQSVQNAFRFWWNEPPGADPHRRNILHARYLEVGIGVARGSWGYYFVADFGSR